MTAAAVIRFMAAADTAIARMSVMDISPTAATHFPCMAPGLMDMEHKAIRCGIRTTRLMVRTTTHRITTRRTTTHQTGTRTQRGIIHLLASDISNRIMAGND